MCLKETKQIHSYSNLNYAIMKDALLRSLYVCQGSTKYTYTRKIRSRTIVEAAEQELA